MDEGRVTGTVEDRLFYGDCNTVGKTNQTGSEWEKDMDRKRNSNGRTRDKNQEVSGGVRQKTQDRNGCYSLSVVRIKGRQTRVSKKL